MKRSTFIKGLLGFAGAGVLTGLYSWQIGPYWLEFVEKDMPVKNLPKSLEGLTLMQISDIHVGNRFDWHYLIESFRKAQKLNPDFVVYTGDYVTYKDREQLSQLKEVLKYTVRGKLATAGILGNHDYGHGWKESTLADEIQGMLENHGITMLRNAQQDFDGLNIIGFDDYWATNFHPEKVMKDYDASKANLLLCHNPDVCDLNVWNGYQGWILAGHTHGGQVKPPFLDAPMLPVKNKRYAAGEIDLGDGRTLYINRALGCLWQVRLNVRPEITLFKLRQG
jgi:predicted MPP superfamily phosphohydrolase